MSKLVEYATLQIRAATKKKIDAIYFAAKLRGEQVTHDSIVNMLLDAYGKKNKSKKAGNNEGT